MASAVASKSEEKKSKAQAPAAAHDGVFQLEASVGEVAPVGAHARRVRLRRLRKNRCWLKESRRDREKLKSMQE